MAENVEDRICAFLILQMVRAGLVRTHPPLRTKIQHVNFAQNGAHGVCGVKACWVRD